MVMKFPGNIRIVTRRTDSNLGNILDSGAVFQLRYIKNQWDHLFNALDVTY